LLRAGFGWSIVSEIAAREDAAAGRIETRPLAPVLSRDPVLVWRQDRAARLAIAAAPAIFSAHAAAIGERGT
jgi:DNA-binding transcriptional LysR family regulator